MHAPGDSPQLEFEDNALAFSSLDGCFKFCPCLPPPPKSHIEVLPLGTSECDLIWKRVADIIR